jgi:hypothetical protein
MMEVTSNPPPDVPVQKKQEDPQKPNLICDEYGFPVDSRLLEKYQLFEVKHKRRRERLLTGPWKDVKASTRTNTKNISNIYIISCTRQKKNQRSHFGWSSKRTQSNGTTNDTIKNLLKYNVSYGVFVLEPTK